MEEMCQMAKTLGEFVLNEMQKRGMSAREFADFIGISRQTINRLLDYENPEKSGWYPSLESLIKLSKALKMDICSLIAFIDADVANISTETRILSQQIEQLPENVRDMIDSIIIGATLKRKNEDA